MARTLAALLLTGSIALAHVPEALSQSRFGPWLGTYKNVSMEQTKQVVEDAIEQGTRDMGFIKKKVARSRLEAINPPYEKVRIIEQGDHLITEFDGRRYSAPVDGRAEAGVDPEGKDVKVSYHAEGNTLHARYVGDDGEKRMDFERSADGGELTMHVTVLSKKLPEPVRYSVQYTKD